MIGLLALVCALNGSWLLVAIFMIAICVSKGMKKHA